MDPRRLFLLAWVGSCCLCEGYKILVMFPLPSKSHSILGEGYVLHLLEAGHEVVYVTPFPKNSTHPKLRQIDVSATRKLMDHNDALSIEKILAKKVEPTDPFAIFDLMRDVADITLQAEDMKKILNDPTQEFDVVVIEYSFNEIMTGLSAVYDCPFIWSSSVEPHWTVLQMIHGVNNPAYTPDFFSTSIPPYSFVERAKSLFTLFLWTALQKFYQNPKEDVIYRKHFEPVVARKGRILPDFREVAYNASFLLANSHVSLSQPISLPPNVKEIAGYHIDPKTKPLSKELQKIMDDAKHGVVYFSMGSIWKSKDIPHVIKQDLVKVFGELKQTVLWKFEEDFPNLPKNVHILKWAPQQSILAHPNTRLFITHGGLLSTIETVYFGVPVIAIPVSADQHINAHRAVARGLGLRVELSYDMGVSMKAALEEALVTTKFMERAKQLSQIYHDRPVSPGKELVHWVEHVVKTRGAPHLRSPALMLPWYQKIYLDLATVVLVALYVIKYIIKRLYNKFISSFSKTATVTKKKTN